jgi:hypothetical protein
MANQSITQIGKRGNRILTRKLKTKPIYISTPVTISKVDIGLRPITHVYFNLAIIRRSPGL